MGKVRVEWSRVPLGQNGGASSGGARDKRLGGVAGEGDGRLRGRFLQLSINRRELLLFLITMSIQTLWPTKRNAYASVSVERL